MTRSRKRPSKWLWAGTLVFGTLMFCIGLIWKEALLAGVSGYLLGVTVYSDVDFGRKK